MKRSHQRRVVPALGLALVATTMPLGAGAWAEQSPQTAPIVDIYPDIPNFNSQRLNQQLQLYRQYVLTVGVPDILIIGSSRSLQGIDPAVLQRGLANRGYADLKIYNLGVNGATAQVIDLIVRQILLPEQLPQVLIWGDGLRAFNSGRPDATYAGIVSSIGYQRLLRGEHPIPRPESGQAPQPFDTHECFDLRYLADDAIARSHNLGCLQPRLTETQPILRSLSPLADLEATGFRRIFTQFQPERYFRQFPRVPGAYDGDYVPFRLQGAQTQAMQALTRYLRQRQVPLLIVSLPLSREYLDRTRMQYERQFQQHMQAIAQQEGILWRDWSMRWTTQSHYFADPSHLNQYGAEAVAHALATDATIPWASLLEK